MSESGNFDSLYPEINSVNEPVFYGGKSLKGRRPNFELMNNTVTYPFERYLIVICFILLTI